MLAAERDYQEFIKRKENNGFQFAPKVHGEFMERLNRTIHFYERNPHRNEQEFKYIRWLHTQGIFNYYIWDSPESICLLKRDFNSSVNIGYCRPLPKTKEIVGNKMILEIKSIVSVEKGEGYKIMKKLIALGEKMDCPLSLFTETDKNTTYFERYGFVGYGPHGDNGENLMILQAEGK